MIHWPRVRQLRNEVGSEEFDEVIRIFMEEVAEVILRLKADSARSEIEQNLHFLKGSALSLGFESLSKLCQDGERRAAAGEGAEVDLNAITEAFANSRTAFLSGLAVNL
ncbi:MAG: Hpt domain-containing protein [Ruegeria sp.]